MSKIVPRIPWYDRAERMGTVFDKNSIDQRLKKYNEAKVYIDWPTLLETDKSDKMFTMCVVLLNL